MRTTIRRKVHSLVALTSCFAVAVGCNAVLDNSPGELAPNDAGSGADTSSVFVSRDAAPQGTSQDAGESDADAGAIVPIASDAGTIPTCVLGDKLCNGACVGVDDPLFGCGPAVCTACAVAHATAVCSANGCAVGTCESGYADCDQDPSNGCETDLSQADHCGSCNAKCGSTAPDCAPTVTGFACATGCSGATPTLCGSQCVDLMTSRDDCGSCSNECASVINGVARCASGHCAFGCNASFHACGAACASNVSTATCGTRCTACPTGPNAVPTCNGVACGIECQDGFADCDGNPSNGCEVDLSTNASSCGQCGHSCDGGTCSNRVCSAPPVPDAGSDATTNPPQDSGAPDTGIDSAVPPDDASAGN